MRSLEKLADGSLPSVFFDLSDKAVGCCTCSKPTTNIKVPLAKVTPKLLIFLHGRIWGKIVRIVPDGSINNFRKTRISILKFGTPIDMLVSSNIWKCYLLIKVNKPQVDRSATEIKTFS